ncbi:hypothetical protein FBU59_004825, partial [Linderina macrospora]
MRPLQRSDLVRFYDQLADYMLADGLEFDPTRRVFVVRAVVRMAMFPYLPVFIADCIINLIEFLEGDVLGRLMHCIDEPAKVSPIDTYGYLVALAAMRVIVKQRVRVDSMRNSEVSRISSKIEMTIFSTPLAQAALKNEHLYKYGKYHASKVVRGVINIYSNLSSLVSASIAFYMAKQTMGSNAFLPAYIYVGISLGTRLARLLLDWTSRWYILHPYDHVEEICASITSIKLYAWEKKYLDWAQSYRDDDESDIY